MKKTLISLLLVMVLAMALAVPAMAADTGVGVGSADELTTALTTIDSSTQYIQLTADITDATITESLYLDLNGHNMTGVTISEGVKLYVFDSTTNDYDCADDDNEDGVVDNYGKITVNSGSSGELVRDFVLPNKTFTGSRGRYITIQEQDEEGNIFYSAHRIYLGMVSAVLSPGITAVHYKVELLCDQVVTEHLACTDGEYGYGLKLTVNEAFDYVGVSEEDKPVAYDDSKANAVKWNHRVMRLTNNSGYDAETAELLLQARAYLKLDDGLEITSSPMKKTFRNIVEAAQEQAPALTDIQNNALTGMYERNTALMASWAVPIHCICGGDLYGTVRTEAAHIGDCDHQEIVFAPWKGTDALPLDPGSYYLVNDVTLLERYNLVDNATNFTEDVVMNIDLNGKTVTAPAGSTNGDRAFVLLSSVGKNINLTVTDSSKDYSGKVVHNTKSTDKTKQGVLFFLYDNGDANTATVNIYRATLDASTATGATGVAIEVQDTHSVNLYGATVKGGTATGNGGAIRIASGGAVKAVDTTISAVKAANGGAIYMEGGSVSLTDSIVNGAAAANGGAIYAGGGQITLTDSTVYGGAVTSNGGAIWNSASLTLTNTNVTALQNDKAATNGGAIYSTGTANITGGTILGGDVGDSGGAIAAHGGSFTVTDVEIDSTGKVAGNRGAAVAVGNQAAVTFTMYGNTIIRGGTASSGAPGSGAVTVQDTKTGKAYFIMNDGQIIGGHTETATATNGGGSMRVTSGGHFTMNGGSITGGTATNASVTGGVVLTGTGVMTIAGDAKIYGNGNYDLFLNNSGSNTCSFKIGKDWTANGGEILNIKMATAPGTADGSVIFEAPGDVTDWGTTAANLRTQMLAGKICINDRAYTAPDGLSILYGVNSMSLYDPADKVVHCICGAQKDASGAYPDGHIGTCGGADLIWTAWEKTDSLPTTNDNWYLTDTVTLSDKGNNADATWRLNNTNMDSSDLKLDLNGHTVYAPSSKRFMTVYRAGEKDANIILTDSSAGRTGMIINGNTGCAGASLVYLIDGSTNSKATVSVYRVTMDSSAVTTNTNDGAAIRVNSGQTLNLYGATVVGATNTQSGGSAICNYGGTINVADGSVITGTKSSNGGAIYAGAGTLNLTDSTVTGATATNGGAIYMGGGTATLTNAIVNGAAATEGGGGIHVAGGTLTLENTTVHGAAAKYGGALSIVGGQVTMESGTLNGENATNGAAVQLKAASGKTASFTMNGGTINATDKTANNGGAGVNVDGYNGTSTFTMNGGTINGGIAKSVGGGGSVCVQDGSNKGNGVFNMTGGTITGGVNNAAGNTGYGGGNVRVTNGGHFNMSGGTISGGTDNGAAGAAGVMLNGTTSAMTLSGDATITDELYLNTGKTVAVADDWTGSAVVEMADGIGKFGVAADGDTLTDTQKAGFSHAWGYGVVLEDNALSLDTPKHCVCGANEGEAHLTGCNGEQILWRPWTETDCLPRENGNWYLTDDVTLSKVVSGADAAWRLNQDGMDSSDVKLDLNGNTIKAPSGARVMVLYRLGTKDANVVLTDSSAKHTGRIVNENTGSIEVGLFYLIKSGTPTTEATVSVYRLALDGSKVNYTGTNGGAIRVDAGHTLNLYGVTLDGCVTKNGGAIYNYGGTVHVADSSVINATGSGTTGGAIWNGNSGTMTVSGSTINGGTVTGDGGAIYNQASLTLTNTTVNAKQTETGTNVAINGGAVASSGGTVSITGGKITGGHISGAGGAIYAIGGEFTVTDVEIDSTGKVAGNRGAAVAVGHNANVTFNMRGNTVVKGGTASSAAPGSGAVSVQNTSSGTAVFNMEGGLITGGHTDTTNASYGGGSIRVTTGGEFNMSGGTITGGTAANGHGGVVLAAGSMTLSGNACIAGNEGCDLYLASGKKITISEDWLSDNQQVPMKVIMADKTGDFATGTNLTEAQQTSFVSPSKYGVERNAENTALTLAGVKYCICGANEDEEHIGGCSGQGDDIKEWESWSHSTHLPLTAGYYRLETDVDYSTYASATTDVKPANNRFNTSDITSGDTERTIVIDLNGHTVTGCNNRTIVFRASSTYKYIVNMVITDSSQGHTGQIAGATNSNGQGALIYLWNEGSLASPGSLTVYRATLNASNMKGTYGTALAVEKNFTVNLYGAKVLGGVSTSTSAQGGGAIYTAGNVTIDDGSVITGNTAVTAGAICVNGGTLEIIDSTVNMKDGVTVQNNGGAIRINSGAVTITDSTVTGTSLSGGAANGGAIRISDGSLNLINTTVYGAQATTGGAIAIQGGAVTMTGGKIIGANATNGAAVELNANSANGASFTMNSGIIDASNASTSGCGTAVNINGYTGQSKFIMIDGQIIGGTATSVGGGAVSVQDTNGTGNKGIFEMNGGTISGGISNSTTVGYGGGNVRVTIGGKFEMNGGIITGGTAGNNCGGVVVTGDNSVMILSGDAKIYGNNGCDLFLNTGRTITVKADWEGNGETAMVVKTADAVTESGLTIANASGTLTDAHAAGFTGTDNYEAYAKDDGSAIYLGYPTYCVCGTNDDNHIGECVGTELEWKPWSDPTCLPYTAGNYYLTTDVDYANSTQANKRWNNGDIDNGTEVMDIKIDLNGHTVTGTSARTFVLQAHTDETPVNLTITNSSKDHDGTINGPAYNGAQGGLVYMWNRGGSTLGSLSIYRTTLDASNMTINHGAAICVDAGFTLNLYGATVIGGTAQTEGKGGGAIYNAGTVKIADGSEIIGGTAESGGAIYNTGSVTLADSIVRGASVDTEKGMGGAIYSTGSLTMTDTEVYGAEAYSGGALAILGGNVIMEGGKIVGADVQWNATAIHFDPGTTAATFTMRTSAKGNEPVIDASGKTALNAGGAININGDTCTTTFTMESGIIYGGTAKNGGAVVVQDTVTGGRGIFNMKGGLITGGDSAGGDNVRVTKGGVFNMSGGTITGGKGSGGGVVVTGVNSAMTLSGSAKIYGNLGGDLCLDDRNITIANGWQGNGEDEEGNNNKMFVVYKGTELLVVAKDPEIADWNTTAAGWLGYLTDDAGSLYVADNGIRTTVIDESKLLKHCLCGATDDNHIGECVGEVLTWKPWYSSNSLPFTSGNYYLACEEDAVTLTGAHSFNTNTVPAGTDVDVKLDLNGKTVTRATSGDRLMAITNPNASVKLTITDSSTGYTGKLTAPEGSYTNQGVLVWLRESSVRADGVTGELNLYRVTLDASKVTTTNPGAGIYVQDSNTLNLYSAKIIGGMSDQGGAVCVDTDAVVNVDGSTSITGGKAVTDPEADNNVYLVPGTYLTLGDKLDNANVWITVPAGEGRFTEAENASDANAEFFHADNDGDKDASSAEGYGLYFPSAGYQVGYGEADINPLEVMLPTLHLSGYGTNKVPTSIDETYGLKAQCVAVTDAQGDTVLLINTDLNYIEAWSKDARARISAATGVPVDNIVISADHVHSAPFVDQQGGTTKVDIGDGVMKSYMDIVKDGLVEAATEAMVGRGVISKVEQAVHDGVNDAGSYVFNGVRNYKASLWWNDDLRNSNRNTKIGYLGIYTPNHQSYASPDLMGSWIFGSYTAKEIQKVAESEVDDELQLVKYTYTLNGVEKTLILANFQVHPNLSGGANTKIHADVVGAFRQSLSSLTEDGADVIYFSGAGGNVNPTSSEKDANNFASADFAEYGAALAEIAKNTLDGDNVTVKSGDAMNKDVEVMTTTFTADPYVDTDFTGTSGTISLGTLDAEGNPTEEGTRLYRAMQINADYQACVAAGTSYSHQESDSLVYGIYSPFHAKWMLNRAKGENSNNTMTLGAYAVGDIGFVSAPYEMYDTNGMEIKTKTRYGVETDPDGGYKYGDVALDDPAMKKNGFDMTFVVTQANGSNTYIPSALGYKNGGYSVDTARVAEGTGEDLVDAFLDMLNQLRPAN